MYFHIGPFQNAKVLKIIKESNLAVLYRYYNKRRLNAFLYFCPTER